MIATLSFIRNRIYSLANLFAVTACILLLSACVQSPDIVERSAKSNDTNTENLAPSSIRVYKSVGGIDLSLHIFNPEGHVSGDSKPAIIFFHGGGWNGGHPSHFYRQSRYLAERGMVAISAEYRVNKQHGTDPKASLRDAKSAIRFIRENAQQLGIDADKLAAGGGSAGGHLAAAAATSTAFEDSNDNKAISYRPDLLVLFNPVFDNSPDGFGYSRVKGYWQDFSPLHNITEKTPPGIGFFGEKDTAIKPKSAYQFKQKLAEFGIQFELHIYKDQPHGFFNQVKFQETLVAMDRFLTLHGYLPKLAPKTYYVDAKNGNDNNFGTSKNQAWASVNKVNDSVFMPGDKILFKANTRYNGVLEPKGSGTSDAPIIIDIYGDGAKPIINGWGQKLHTLLLRNLSHWRISNIAITNQGKNIQARRRGVIIEGENAGELDDIELSQVEIYNVNGELVKKKGGGSGLLVRASGDIYPTRFNDLRILNNHIHHTQRNGINFRGYTKRSQWYPSLNVVVKDNLIEQVPGDGIVMVATDGALIEGNLLRDFPDVLPVGDAAAGIWPWSADNTLIQFNEVSGHKAKWDGQGFDSDWNSVGTIIQYNYSHDNYGGFLLVCNNGNSYQEDNNLGTINTIIRGNVSINDGIRPYPTANRGVFSPTFHLTGPIENTLIKDNVIIVPKKAQGQDNTLVELDNWGGPWPMQTLFKDNQIFLQSDSRIDMGKSRHTEFQRNKFNRPIKNLNAEGNTFTDNESFDLEQIKHQALEKLQEIKNNAQK